LRHGLSQGGSGHKQDQKACGLMKLLALDKYNQLVVSDADATATFLMWLAAVMGV